MMTHEYCYLDRLKVWALAAQYEPAKGRFDEGGQAASPMIKSAKDREEEQCSWNCSPSSRGGSS